MQPVSKGNVGIGAAEGAIGECLAAQKRYDEAEALLLDSYQILKATTGQNDARLTEAAQRLANLYRAWGKPQKARFYSGQ